MVALWTGQPFSIRGWRKPKQQILSSGGTMIPFLRTSDMQTTMRLEGADQSALFAFIGTIANAQSWMSMRKRIMRNESDLLG